MRGRLMSKKLMTPDIVLSGQRGSCAHGGFYSPKDNEILLTNGWRIVGEDEAERCIRTLNHELAHWATFLFLSSEERSRVRKAYMVRQEWAAEQATAAGQGIDFTAQGDIYILLEDIAYYARLKEGL